MIHKLIDLYKKKYSLPLESKPAIARKNLTVLSIIFSFLFFFSLTYLCILKFNIRSKAFIYYTIMAGLSLFIVLMRKPLLKINNYYLSQFFLIFSIIWVLVLITYGLFSSPSYLAALINFYISSLFIVICLDITPIAHLCLEVTFSALLTYLAPQKNIPLNLLANNYIFCICIILLALYKRNSVKKREELRIQIEEQNKQLEINNIELGQQKDSLLITKGHLEEFINSQTEELQQQNERIIHLQNNTIVSLSNLVENRDEDTGNHVQRTRDYVELIARIAQQTGKFKELDDEMLYLLSKAAPMHDIGKIVLPDAILKKPGRLTPDEFELIKLHTTKGGSIIEEIFEATEDENYVKIAKEIAISHHEKYDGSGYPFGLKGEEIPLCGRIMAIADVYDALVSPRCYKPPLSEEEAFKIISESAGKHFDPVLAKIFVDARTEVIKIHQKYM